MKKRVKATSFGLVLAASLAVTGFAAAQDAPTGASASVQGSGNLTPDTGNTAGSVTTEAGGVSQVRIETNSQTGKWAGFFGTVGGSIVLGDGSNNFYEWTSSDFANSKVVAVPSGDSAPSTISQVSNPGTFLGSEYQGGSDSASNTFTGSDTISLTGSEATNTAMVQTLNDGGSDTFKTFLASNDNAGGSPVYIANATAQQSGFDGTNVNYQMLVGVGESSDQKTYDFYLELP